MDAQTLHDISKKVLQAKDKVEQIEYVLRELKESKTVSARLELEFDRNRRSYKTFWLGRSDLIPVFEKELKEAKEDLAGFENDFKNYTS